MRIELFKRPVKMRQHVVNFAELPTRDDGREGDEDRRESTVLTVTPVG